ncbi:M4 family metallopeptidase [Alteribacter keqinensis]|uniref:Neutral metalloproteinase n=1 Tax=Alteribacter keqinensis TaxID=2483800 RepID=A0A3M7TNK2_9BACI|nr:M4 family metallopeptidase [Alteribacter keqinensis]RNA66587.1 peptidase M4 family protein [Alteribacter keqinensis]
MKKFAALTLSALIFGSGFLGAGGSGFAEGDSLKKFESLGKGDVKVVQGKGQKGPPTFVSGILSENFSKGNAKSAKAFLSEHEELFHVKNAEESLTEVRVTEDELGMTHVRLQQTKKGIPVDRNELNVHFNEDNSITAVNGNFDPELEELEINTTPAVNRNTALETAKKDVSAPEYVDFQTSELIIYPFEADYHLAYRINLEFHSATPGNWYVYVDAHTGEVIDRFDAMTGLGNFSDILDLEEITEQPQATAAQVKAKNEKAQEKRNELRGARGKGLGTTGVQKLMDISHGLDEDGGRTFYLADHSTSDMDGIFTYNMQNTSNQMWLYENDSASWKDVEYSGDSSSWEVVGQGPAVDAHSNSRIVYDYFLENHGRNSLDDQGMAIESRVHYWREYNNAFWSNGLAMMTYGDGDGQQFIPLAALDVTAHEMVHGITHYNGGLRYRFETGAINEAYSDTFGSIIDDRSWDVGEDIMGEAWLADGRTALRSSEDPGKFPVNQAYWAYSVDGEGRYPAHMEEYYFLPGNMDNGGVHINCTILQHSAYLVSEEYGMGREVVADTWYRAYDYLHFDATFAEFREAILQSATDLYGEDSEEYDAFLGAFDDIGLYEGWSLEENHRSPLW